MQEEKESKVCSPRCGRAAQRWRRHRERVDMLARPNPRRLRCLWDEACHALPLDRRDKIKSALEEDYFLSPEQTEQYFQSLQKSQKPCGGGGGGGSGGGVLYDRKEQAERQKHLKQRQKWLIDFSAQVAYRMCDYVAKGQKELLVSNRLRSIADVVLERVAQVLGEPKPSRAHPGRLQRFMVAISDRIAVWIENAVYQADEALEEDSKCDDHMSLDSGKAH
ncbi:uncharacterized protein LOC105386518 [Plutella xylostella]|uniref:uncharacterized protein LOC105386518 n=1 Tax=Plutella xylostella TaxID=51655 RepID=UPI0005D0A0B4|nr:uncharacterized protein LOC105386518 [Plutella xylostella]